MALPGGRTQAAAQWQQQQNVEEQQSGGNSRQQRENNQQTGAGAAAAAVVEKCPSSRLGAGGTAAGMQLWQGSSRGSNYPSSNFSHHTPALHTEGAERLKGWHDWLKNSKKTYMSPLDGRHKSRIGVINTSLGFRLNPSTVSVITCLQ